MGKERKLELSNIDSKNVLGASDKAIPGCSNGHPQYIDVETSFNLLNAYLTSVGESSVMKKKCTKSILRRKTEKIQCKLNEACFQIEDLKYNSKWDCENA